MRLFSKIRENLQKNRGTLAQKLMGGMGMMERMPEGMRPRRGEGIVQGMFPRLDKRRMGRMPSIEELIRFARENNLPLPPGLRDRFPIIDDMKPGVIIEPEVGVGLEPPIMPPPLPPGGEDRPRSGMPIEGGSGSGGISRMPEPDMRTMPIGPTVPFEPKPEMTTMPMMPPTRFRPKPPSKGMPIDPGRMPRFKGGGSVYPNKGLAALAEVAPEVVKRMGYEGGGAVANYPRRSAQMMIDELMDSIQNGSPEQMAEKSFLLDRLQELDLSPEQQNQVFVISRMLKERNIPIGGMKVTETSIEMMPGERGRDISDRDRNIISGFIPPTEPPIQKMLEQMNTR